MIQDNITFNNVAFQTYAAVNDILSRDSAAKINAGKGRPIVNAVSIDWNGAEVDENKVINTTGQLLAWIKEGLAAAAQSGGAGQGLTEEQLETINTCSNLLAFIKQYALSTAYANEHYQAKGDYVLASVYNENKAAIDSAIEVLQQAANGITEERIATIESNLSNATTALLSKVDEARVNAIVDAKGYQTEAQVNTKIQAVVGAAPEALDTLKEIADKLGDNDDVVAGLTNQITGKADAADVYNKTEADTKFATKESVNELVEEVNNANETAAEALVQLQEQITNISLTPGEKGERGDKGDTGATGPKGDTGNDGADGKSAFELAQADGFTGTQSEWLASLKGPKGDTGTFDASALDNYATKTFVTEKIADVVGGAPETLDTLKEIADWVSEHGEVTGIKGDTGATGAQGPQGEKGDTGTFDSSALAGYVTIEQYNALLARVDALEAQISGDEPVVDNTYITPNKVKPTSESIAEIQFPSQKPVESLTLETSEITRPTEVYLVYPTSWVTATNDDEITNPIITDHNGYNMGVLKDSIVTVDGVSYTIMVAELGIDTYTITFS